MSKTKQDLQYIIDDTIKDMETKGILKERTNREMLETKLKQFFPEVSPSIIDFFKKYKRYL